AAGGIRGFPVTGVQTCALPILLFYDPVVSADSTVSCASCHKPQFAFADNTPLSSRVFGVPTTRNTQPLIDMGMNKKFFWDARVRSEERRAGKGRTARDAVRVQG